MVSEPRSSQVLFQETVAVFPALETKETSVNKKGFTRLASLAWMNSSKSLRPGSCRGGGGVEQDRSGSLRGEEGGKSDNREGLHGWRLRVVDDVMEARRRRRSGA